MLKLYSTSFLLFVLLSISSCVGYNSITKSELITTSFIQKSEHPKSGWKKIPIYDDNDLLLTPYRVISKIIITGNESTMDKGLIRKMKKEASRYQADAIIFKKVREVERTSVNGFAIAINIITLFDDTGSEQLDMGGDYIAYEYEGIAIKFLEEN
ncbi:MAG: hypothetical protein AB8H03_23870 [Saprospiraceae bacterium]